MTREHKSRAQCIRLWLTAALVAAASATAVAQEPTRKFIMHELPKPIGAIQFQDGQGQSRSLGDFHGKVVLLNIWATWCIPCRKEMPTLDRLQSTLGGPHFEVVALSIDRGGLDVVRKFFADVGIHNLPMYLDTSGKALRELGAVGLPTTFLVDRQGREVGRLIGPAEWDAPEMVEFINCAISGDEAARNPTDSKPVATLPCSEHTLDLPASGARTNSQP